MATKTKKIKPFKLGDVTLDVKADNFGDLIEAIIVYKKSKVNVGIYRADIAEYAVKHEFGTHGVAKRPFIDPGLRLITKEKGYEQDLVDGLMSKSKAKSALKKIGNHGINAITSFLRENKGGYFVETNPTPLIDTHAMMNSITFRIER